VNDNDGAHIRVGVGTRVIREGQLFRVAEVHAGGPSGAEVVLCSHGMAAQYLRMSMRDLLMDCRYRLVSEATIEEKVVALQEHKRALFAKVVDEGGLMGAPLSADDIRGLLG